MIKLLKSDFYRLAKSKSLYICSAVGSLLFILVVVLLKFSTTMTDTLGELPYSSAMSFGHTVFTGGDVHLLMAIFISIFVTAEFVHGTMKNTIAKGYSRTLVYLSKLIASTVASYIMLLIVFIVSVLSYLVVFGNLGSLSGKEVLIILIELFLHSSLASIFLLIAMIIRNNGGTIAINIICITLIFPQLFTLLDVIFDHKIQFTNYSLLHNMMMYAATDQNFTNGEIIRSVIVGGAYLGIMTLLGIIAFKKQDVK